MPSLSRNLLIVLRIVFCFVIAMSHLLGEFEAVCSAMEL